MIWVLFILRVFVILVIYMYVFKIIRIIMCNKNDRRIYDKVCVLFLCYFVFNFKLILLKKLLI